MVCGFRLCIALVELEGVVLDALCILESIERGTALIDGFTLWLSVRDAEVIADASSVIWHRNASIVGYVGGLSITAIECVVTRVWKAGTRRRERGETIS
jgi:hypothetical protein